MLKATHEGIINIDGENFYCAVLENEQRVIVIDFDSKLYEIIEILQREESIKVKFMSPNDKEYTGYSPEIIPLSCETYLRSSIQDDELAEKCKRIIVKLYCIGYVAIHGNN